MAAELDVNLEENRVEGSLEVAIDVLFIDGELRLWEDDDGWAGYEFDSENEAYYYVNKWLSPDNWARRIRVGERAVRLAIESHLANPAAGGVGRFERGVAP